MEATKGTTTLTFKAGTKTIVKTYPQLAPNVFYTAGGTGGYAPIEPDIPTPPTGALNGLFTVADPDGTPNSGDEKKVYFSKGNLQCVKTGTTWEDGYTWKFAENQWETVETGVVSADYANESVIGLFGWGCTGNVPSGDEFYLYY